jgi:hypothetical protein
MPKGEKIIMTSRDFCYWLQGYMEISKNSGMQSVNQPVLFAKQVEVIQQHLNMVFIHDIDPAYGEDNQKLNEIHSGGGTINKPVARC